MGAWNNPMGLQALLWDFSLLGRLSYMKGGKRVFSLVEHYSGVEGGGLLKMAH